jgi:hypothetical protein
MTGAHGPPQWQRFAVPGSHGLIALPSIDEIIDLAVKSYYPVPIGVATVTAFVALSLPIIVYRLLASRGLMGRSREGLSPGDFAGAGAATAAVLVAETVLPFVVMIASSLLALASGVAIVVMLVLAIARWRAA